MKKIYFILFSIITTYSFGQFGQIMNGGFENWTNQTLYDYPTQWGNSNSDEYRGTPTVLQSTDAQDGTYSVEIRSEQAGPDTLFGYVYHGAIGQSGPSGGIGYNDIFNEVRFQYKSNLAANDSLYLIAIRYTWGTMTEMIIQPIVGGTNSTWTQGSVSVASNTQDALFIGFVMGNPFGGPKPTPGDWARIDKVELYNTNILTTLLPDNSFEDWSVQTVETPDMWFTLDEMLAGQGLNNANKTTDANSGNFAVELTTVVNQNNDTITGMLSMGPIMIGSGGPPFLPVPYAATPTTFSGAYKYSSGSGTDMGFANIMFFNNGSTIGSHTEMFSDAATYQTFSSSLSLSGTPDSIVFFVFSGDSVGSSLKLDDLSFSGGDVSLDEFNTMSTSVYPNPANDYVYVKAQGSFDLAVLNLDGTVVYASKNNAGAVKVELGDYATGQYIVKIQNEAGIETHKIIVE